MNYWWLVVKWRFLKREHIVSQYRILARVCVPYSLQPPGNINQSLSSPFLIKVHPPANSRFCDVNYTNFYIQQNLNFWNLYMKNIPFYQVHQFWKVSNRPRNCWCPTLFVCKRGFYHLQKMFPFDQNMNKTVMFFYRIVRWKISAISFFYTNFMSNFGYFTLFMEWIWYIWLCFSCKN